MSQFIATYTKDDTSYTVKILSDISDNIFDRYIIQIIQNGNQLDIILGDVITIERLRGDMSNWCLSNFISYAEFVGL